MRAVLPSILFVSAAFAWLACGDDDLRRGEAFTPDGALAAPTPVDRSDAAGVDAGTDAGSLPIRDAGPDVNTTPIGTCETARAIGTVSGDTGGGSLGAKGSCSEWISFRATEDDNSAFGTGMKAKLTMTPTGHDFDLYAFFDPNRDVVACNAPFARSEQGQLAVETIPLTWGEGTVANGSDDGRTIRVLVQSTAEACPAGATWSLVVGGNQ